MISLFSTYLNTFQYSLARSFIQYKDAAMPQHSPSQAEKLLLALTKMELVHVCVKPTLLFDGAEQLHALESGENCRVGLLAGWISVEPH